MEKTGAQTPTGLAQDTHEVRTETEDVESAETQRLLEESELANFRGRWTEIQARFVDDLVQRLTERFTQQRSELEADWDRHDAASTENLRVALRRYRFFFNRLLET